MNRPRLPAVAVLWVCLAGPVMAASDAADSAYWDFRIPAHHWSQWTAGVAGTGDRSQVTSPGDVTTREGSLQAELSTVASGGSDSEPLSQNWRVSLRLGGSRRNYEESRSYSIGDTRNEFSNRNVSEFLSAAYSIRAYPWAFPLGFSANAGQFLSMTQFFNASEYAARDPSGGVLEQGTSSDRRLRSRTSFGLGLGLGRVRDVTCVHEALVLEERLLATGGLTRPLSHAARQELASLFAMQPRVAFAHGRPDKYFWAEVERLLAEDGALAGGSLDLYSAHRVLESLTIRGRMLRWAGWFVGPQVQLEMEQNGLSYESSRSTRFYQADTLFDLFESGSSSHRNDRQEDISTSLFAEFHHPSGPRWQYDADIAMRIAESGSPIDLFTALRVSWIVTDRWLITGGVFHEVFLEGQGFNQPPEDWRFSARAELSYFLEDAWAVSLGVSEGQVNTATGHDRQGGVSLGISYVISGLFDAPGLTAAMRPEPGGR